MFKERISLKKKIKKKSVEVLQKYFANIQHHFIIIIEYAMHS